MTDGSIFYTARLALLDWDGTFCDSRQSIYDINVEMAQFYGVQMPPFHVWLQSAHPGVEACMRSLGVTKSREEINDFFHRLLVSQRDRGFQNPLYPDAETLLQRFAARKIPTVIISRHLHEHLVMDIEAHGLSRYFSEIIGEPENQNLDKAEVIQSTFAFHEVSPKETFYLGDTVHDMKLAISAGVTAIAVSHGYDPVHRLEESGPTHIFHSLAEVAAHF